MVLPPLMTMRLLAALSALAMLSVELLAALALVGGYCCSYSPLSLLLWTSLEPSASLPGPQPAAGPHLPPAPLPAAAELYSLETKEEFRSIVKETLKQTLGCDVVHFRYADDRVRQNTSQYLLVFHSVLGLDDLDTRTMGPCQQAKAPPRPHGRPPATRHDAESWLLAVADLRPPKSVNEALKRFKKNEGFTAERAVLLAKKYGMAPSLRAPRPASPQCPGPGAATWPRYAGEGRADLPQESASALGALRFGHGAAAARGPAAPWGDGGPCWWQKGHGAQREESGGAPMGGGRLHQRRQRGTPPFGGSGGSGGQSGSGGYSDSGSGSSAGSGDGLPYRFAGGGAIGGPPSGKLGEPVFIQPSWGGLVPGGQPAPGLEMRQAWTGRSAFSTGRRPMYTVAPAPSLSLLRCLGEQGGSGR
ncbi:unnamed protein product [Prorocentrum cordatum]|uniref:Uncharacterized protein n=1 Tax=Prorocentrum cordatum TaxID=2364126 RepID=A0ABN9SI37_9DINO|nr:unnamed protein product [Polarella glacialis]